MAKQCFLIIFKIVKQAPHRFFVKTGSPGKIKMMDIVYAGFADGFGVESLIIRQCDGSLTPATRVRVPLGLPG